MRPAMTLTPGAAVMWTFLVPGLAHFRLGRAARGLAALVTTSALFWLGHSMLGWGEGHSVRLWFFALFEPFSILRPVLSLVPVQLLPESANLGNTIVAALLRPDAVEGLSAGSIQRMMRAPSEWQHIGSFLTAGSGMVAIFWAVDAHWLAGKGSSDGRRIRRPLATCVCVSFTAACSCCKSLTP